MGQNNESIFLQCMLIEIMRLKLIRSKALRIQQENLIYYVNSCYGYLDPLYFAWLLTKQTYESISNDYYYNGFLQDQDGHKFVVMWYMCGHVVKLWLVVLQMLLSTKENQVHFLTKSEKWVYFFTLTQHSDKVDVNNWWKSHEENAIIGRLLNWTCTCS